MTMTMTAMILIGLVSFLGGIFFGTFMVMLMIMSQKPQ